MFPHGYSKGRWGRFYPDLGSAENNLKNFLGASKDKNVPGFMVTSWGDDGAECLYSFIKPLLLATMEIAEGNCDWKNKWLYISGEKKEILNLRINLGNPAVSWNLKQVMLTSLKLDKKTRLMWNKLDDEMNSIKMSDNLRFIHNLLNADLKKLDNNLKPSKLSL